MGYLDVVGLLLVAVFGGRARSLLSPYPIDRSGLMCRRFIFIRFPLVLRIGYNQPPFYGVLVCMIGSDIPVG